MKKCIFAAILSAVVLLLCSCGTGGSGGADLKIKKSNSEIAFEENIREIIKNGGDLNQKDDGGIPLMVWAAMSQYADTIEMMLNNGADPNIAIDRELSTPLHNVIESADMVAKKGPLKKLHEQETINAKRIIELLAAKGAIMNARDCGGETPLHKAAQYGRDDLCELLLNKGAYVNDTDQLGRTPLHEAAIEGYWKVVQLLLNRGADKNITDRLGDYPLLLAEKRSDEDLQNQIRKDSPHFYPNNDYDKTIELLK